jgi:hypothetical protein
MYNGNLGRNSNPGSKVEDLIGGTGMGGKVNPNYHCFWINRGLRLQELGYELGSDLFGVNLKIKAGFDLLGVPGSDQTIILGT